MVSELMDERQRWNRLAKEKKLGQVENRDGWFYEKELGARATAESSLGRMIQVSTHLKSVHKDQLLE
jgi:hypothetical protein